MKLVCRPLTKSGLRCRPCRAPENLPWPLLKLYEGITRETFREAPALQITNASCTTCQSSLSLTWKPNRTFHQVLNRRCLLRSGQWYLLWPPGSSVSHQQGPAEGSPGSRCAAGGSCRRRLETGSAPGCAGRRGLLAGSLWQDPSPRHRLPHCFFTCEVQARTQGLVVLGALQASGFLGSLSFGSVPLIVVA